VFTSQVKVGENENVKIVFRFTRNACIALHNKTFIIIRYWDSAQISFENSTKSITRSTATWQGSQWLCN